MAVENLITEHIDIWTSAVKARSTSGRGSSKKLELYGVKKLRELILELAVRGKLVPQNPNDEPASFLLQRISEEKTQLIKEKKITKPKKLPAIKKQDITFALPEGWQACYFGDIYSLVYGDNLPKAKRTESGEFLVYGSNGSVGTHNLFSVGSPCLVIGRKGSAGAINLSDQPCWVTDVAYSLIPPVGISLKYCFLHLQTLGLDSLGKGIKPGLNRNEANALVVCIPPSDEQHRIVAKVDELMALCDQLEQQTETSIEAHQVLVTTLLNTLTNSADADELMQNWARISEHFDTLFTTEESIDQLKQAILQLAVMGKLVSFGNSRKTMLKELLSFGPRNGLSPKEAPSRTELKVLKLGATSYGSLDLEQSKYIDVDIKDKPYLCLTRGDILIQRGNSANFVGSNVLIQEDYHNYIYPDLMMKLRVNQLISPEFLSLVLSANASREHMWKQMTGTSGTMPKISKKVVEGLPVTFPTNKNIQVEVVSQTNKLIALCDKLRTRLTGCSETKATLCDVMTQQAY